jgi:hypothetical protein
MAKKTIFEGVINDRKFDNVKDYNEYLTKLINAGESFNASTSTRAECETCCENCCETCSEDECSDKKTPVILMLPGFDNGDNKEYIDGFISDNADEDVASLAVLKEKLADNLEGIIHRVHSMDEAALENYEDDVEEVQDIIVRDAQDTEYVIGKKEAELQKLKRSLAVLNVWKDSYASIKSCIEDAQTKYQSESCEPTPTKEDVDEQVAKELEERLVGAMSKLMDCFGINLKDIKNLKIGY